MYRSYTISVFETSDIENSPVDSPLKKSEIGICFSFFSFPPQGQIKNWEFFPSHATLNQKEGLWWKNVTNFSTCFSVAGFLPGVHETQLIFVFSIKEIGVYIVELVSPSIPRIIWLFLFCHLVDITSSIILLLSFYLLIGRNAKGILKKKKMK